jgi:hypothetical protein
MVRLKARQAKKCGRRRSIATLLAAWGGLALAMLTVFAMTGCGKKAPPVPPEGEQRPPMVMDLSGRIDNGELILAWTVPTPTEQNPLIAVGFNVLVDQQPSGEPCPNCPPDYETVGLLKVLGNLEIAAGSQTMHFRMPVESGYRYRVAVVAISDGGTAGPESNTLRLEN